MSLISCDNLAFAYDGVTVLHGLNFKIEQGEFSGRTARARVR